MSVKVGDKVPDFSLESDEEGVFNIADVTGNLVIYFYPKDDTPGCTKETKEFDAHLESFKALNADVVGISKDSIASHVNFKKKQGLKIKLLSDPNNEVAKSFGVLVQKSMFGKSYTGIDRSTFLVNSNGIISKSWYKVKVNGHVPEVLKIARALFT